MLARLHNYETSTQEWAVVTSSKQTPGNGLTDGSDLLSV